MKNARLVVNILILVLIPILANRQKIQDFVTDKTGQLNDSPAVQSMKDTSAKTYEGAKNISSNVYKSTKETISNVSSSVGEKIEDKKEQLKQDNSSDEQLAVPKIFQSKSKTNAQKKKDIEEIEKITVRHEKEIDSNMLENIAKLNDDKVRNQKTYDDDYTSSPLHQKHKAALDSKSDEVDVNSLEDNKTESTEKSLFNKHRELQEEQIQKIGRKTGY